MDGVSFVEQRSAEFTFPRSWFMDVATDQNKSQEVSKGLLSLLANQEAGVCSEVMSPNIPDHSRGHFSL